MRGHAQLMSSARTATGKDDWCTPPEILDRVRSIAPIGLDPCCTDDNTTTSYNWFTEKTDGLAQNWRDWCPAGTLTYVNVPYSKARLWAAKMAVEAALGTPIVSLVPARTDTKWWSVMRQAADSVAFWQGRLRFVGAESCAPFPSAFFGFNVPPRAFRAAFADAAWVVIP